MVAPVIGAAAVQALGSVAGGLMDMYQTNKANDKSYKFQKKVLQNQVQWRVRDAVKAGLHPLAALGMSPATGPSAVVGNAGSFLERMGSGLAEAVRGIETPEQKAAGALLLQRGQLENDLLSQQILSEKARLAQLQSPGGSGSSVDQSPIALQTPWGPFVFGNRNAGQIAENAGGEGASWFFGGLETADSAVKNVVGDPLVNTQREIKKIVEADIWAQARADLAKTWARGVADINRIYEPGGFWKALGY